MDVLTLLGRGGLLMLPIGVCSVIGLALAVHRILYFARTRRQNDRAHHRLVTLAQARRLRDAQSEAELMKGPVAALGAALLGAWELPTSARDAIVKLAADRLLREVEWGLRPLEVIGRIAPLLGLLGTVVGLVQAFLVFSRGGTPDPTLLAGGIWQALLTTVAGLVVAIPAVITFEWCESRAEEVAFEMQAVLREIERSLGE